MAAFVGRWSTEQHLGNGGHAFPAIAETRNDVAVLCRLDTFNVYRSDWPSVPGLSKSGVYARWEMSWVLQ